MALTLGFKFGKAEQVDDKPCRSPGGPGRNCQEGHTLWNGGSDQQGWKDPRGLLSRKGE